MPDKDFEKFINYTKKYNCPADTIFEIGARDCAETLAFHHCFPLADIYSFECNPATLPTCRKRTKNIPNIRLIEKAVCENDGKIKFYPIDKERTITTHADGNQGASSMLQASGEYPIESYAQFEIEVDSTRLDTIISHKKIAAIDILWMDIQGAELMALKSLGTQLKNVKIIHTEVSFIHVYKGQPLFDDIKTFLNKNNFRFVNFLYKDKYQANAVFINNSWRSRWDVIKMWFLRK